MQTIGWATSSPVRTWIYLLDHQPSPVKEWWNCLFKPRQYHVGTQSFNKKFPMPIHPCTLLWKGKEKSGSVDSLLEPPPVPRSKWDDSTTPAWMKVTRQASNWSGRGGEVHLDVSATLNVMEISLTNSFFETCFGVGLLMFLENFTCIPRKGQDKPMLWPDYLKPWSLRCEHTYTVYKRCI